MEKIMEIVKFCVKNKYIYTLETLSNGVVRAVIEAKDSLSAKEIIEKAESNGFRTMATAYGCNTVAIYTPEGWKEHMKMFEIDTVTTIDDMLDSLNKAKALLGGKAPFTVVTDHGEMNLTNNDNIIIHNGALVINASDWSTLDKDMDF